MLGLLKIYLKFGDSIQDLIEISEKTNEIVNDFFKDL